MNTTLFQLLILLLEFNYRVFCLSDNINRVGSNSKPYRSYTSNSAPAQNSNQNNNGRGGERRSFSSNKNKFDFGNNDDAKKDTDKWKSGYIFNQYNRKQQRNDPWWMR